MMEPNQQKKQLSAPRHFKQTSPSSIKKAKPLRIYTVNEDSEEERPQDDEIESLLKGTKKSSSKSIASDTS